MQAQQLTSSAFEAMPMPRSSPQSATSPVTPLGRALLPKTHIQAQNRAVPTAGGAGCHQLLHAAW